MIGIYKTLRRALAAFSLLGVLSSHGASVSDGFEETVIVDSINAATTFTILPDGRVLFAEQTGYLRMVVGDELLPEPALDISDRLDTYWERGLVGLTLDGDFPLSPYVYMVYVAKDPYTHHVISRFTLEGNRVDPKSELVLLRGDDQSKIESRLPAGHQGGPIRFGPDGKLYIGIGEQLNGMASQSLTTIQGKILRINPDGSIPEGNPFYRQTYGKYRSIYAYGIRNPWGMDFMPGTDRLFESEVGQSSFEEINEIHWGQNYGWPLAEGVSEIGGYTNPIYTYTPATGRSIGGGEFYPKDGNFPDSWRGKYFFSDWAANWVKAIDVENPDDVQEFAKDLDSPVWIETHPDGSLWVLSRGTIWRDGKKYKENAGNLARFRYVGEGKGGSQETPFPTFLSETGLFAETQTFKEASGVVPFEMNAPVWQPGVVQRNWMKLPKGGVIQFSGHENWVFPEGSLVVQHFDTTAGLPHETHVYWSRGDGRYRAAAYGWAGSSKDAELIPGTIMEALPGSDTLWFSPGPERMLDPQLALVGFMPQFNTRQLNNGTQLRDWSRAGFFDRKLSKSEIEKLPRLASLDDPEASIDLKVRSYLDVNCAVCHHPGGPSRGFYDARFSTPLEEQKLIYGELMAGDMGIFGAKVVVPGDPDRSILYQRIKDQGAFKMPPVAIHGKASPILPLVETWIREMKVKK